MIFLHGWSSCKGSWTIRPPHWILDSSLPSWSSTLRRYCFQNDLFTTLYKHWYTYMAGSSLREEISRFDFSTGVQSFCYNSQNSLRKQLQQYCFYWLSLMCRYFVHMQSIGWVHWYSWWFPVAMEERAFISWWWILWWLSCHGTLWPHQRYSIYDIHVFYWCFYYVFL